MASLEYYDKSDALQDAILESEMKRMGLQYDFLELMKSSNQHDGMRYMQLKTQKQNLDVYQTKCLERNHQIRTQMQEFDANMAVMSAKTEKLRTLKNQYEEYIERMYPRWKDQVEARSVHMKRQQEIQADMVQSMDPRYQGGWQTVPTQQQSLQYSVPVHYNHNYGEVKVGGDNMQAQYPYFTQPPAYPDQSYDDVRRSGGSVNLTSERSRASTVTFDEDSLPEPFYKTKSSTLVHANPAGTSPSLQTTAQNRTASHSRRTGTKLEYRSPQPMSASSVLSASFSDTQTDMEQPVPSESFDQSTTVTNTTHTTSHVTASPPTFPDTSVTSSHTKDVKSATFNRSSTDDVTPDDSSVARLAASNVTSNAAPVTRQPTDSLTPGDTPATRPLTRVVIPSTEIVVAEDSTNGEELMLPESGGIYESETLESPTKSTVNGEQAALSVHPTVAETTMSTSSFQATDDEQKKQELDVTKTQEFKNFLMGSSLKPADYVDSDSSEDSIEKIEREYAVHLAAKTNTMPLSPSSRNDGTPLTSGSDEDQASEEDGNPMGYTPSVVERQHDNSAIKKPEMRLSVESGSLSTTSKSTARKPVFLRTDSDVESVSDSKSAAADNNKALAADEQDDDDFDFYG